MKTATIVIPVVKAFEMVLGAVQQVKKHTHDIDWEIIICDQVEGEKGGLLNQIFQDDSRIKVIRYERAGYGYAIDKALELARGEYFCSLDADCFPIADNWLSKPIGLLDKHNLMFVGNHTGLHLSYAQHGKFVCINNWYRVGRTDKMRELSRRVGFSRKSDLGKKSRKVEEPVDWEADDGVAANWYSDLHEMGDKLTMPITRAIGSTPEQGLYGMVAGDMVFHFVFGVNARQDVYNKPAEEIFGKEYFNLREKMESEGFNNENIDKLMAMTKPRKDCWKYWDCKNKTETLYEDFTI